MRYNIESKNVKEKIRAQYFLTKSKISKLTRKEFDKYVNLRDSLEQVQRKILNDFAIIKYEVAKFEKEKEILQIDNYNKQLLLENERRKKNIGYLISFSSVLLLGISINFFINRRKRTRFKHQLEKASIREKERKQIAKNLHDEVTGDIRVLHQKLEKNNQLKIAADLDKIKIAIRNLSHQLSSVNFDEVSFKNQVINLLSDYLSSTFKIKVDGIDDLKWSIIKPGIKRTLFLCLRECIQNSWLSSKKHIVYSYIFQQHPSLIRS